MNYPYSPSQGPYDANAYAQQQAAAGYQQPATNAYVQPQQQAPVGYQQQAPVGYQQPATNAYVQPQQQAPVGYQQQTPVGYQQETTNAYGQPQQQVAYQQPVNGYGQPQTSPVAAPVAPVTTTAAATTTQISVNVGGGGYTQPAPQQTMPLNRPTKQDWSWFGCPNCTKDNAIIVLLMDIFLGPLGVMISSALDTNGCNGVVVAVGIIQSFTCWFVFGYVWSFISGILTMVNASKA